MRLYANSTRVPGAVKRTPDFKDFWEPGWKPRCGLAPPRPPTSTAFPSGAALRSEGKQSCQPTGVLCTWKPQPYQINMLKNSPHALQPGSRAKLEGFVSVILRKNLRTKPRDQTLRAQTQLRTLSLKAVAQHAPSQKDGPAVPVALRRLRNPLAFTASPRPCRRAPVKQGYGRLSGGRAGRDAGSAAAGEPRSSRSWGCTRRRRLTPRTQRQGKFTERGTEKKTKRDVLPSKK